MVSFQIKSTNAATCGLVKDGVGLTRPINPFEPIGRRTPRVIWEANIEVFGRLSPGRSAGLLLPDGIK